MVCFLRRDASFRFAKGIEIEITNKATQQVNVAVTGRWPMGARPGRIHIASPPGRLLSHWEADRLAPDIKPSKKRLIVPIILSLSPNPPNAELLVCASKGSVMVSRPGKSMETVGFQMRLLIVTPTIAPQKG